jgi:hypothetical protein
MSVIVFYMPCPVSTSHRWFLIFHLPLVVDYSWMSIGLLHFRSSYFTSRCVLHAVRPTVSICSANVTDTVNQYNVLHANTVYRRSVGGVNQALRRNRHRPAKIRRYTIANGRWHIQLCWRACTMSLLLCIGLESHPKSCYLERSFSSVSLPFRMLSGTIT